MADTIGIQAALNRMAGTDNLGVQGAANAAMGSFAGIPRTRKFVTGRYYGPQPQGTPGVSAQGTGVLTVVPFWVPATFTADRIGAEITTGAATAVGRLGIWSSNSNDFPSTLLVDAGTIDASAASSILTKTISQVFTPGLYWLGLVSQVASATFRTAGQGGLSPVVDTTFAATSGANGINCYYQTGITGALADWPAAWAAAGTGYLVKVRSA